MNNRLTTWVARSTLAGGGIGHFVALADRRVIGFPRIAFAPPDGGANGGTDLRSLGTAIQAHATATEAALTEVRSIAQGTQAHLRDIEQQFVRLREGGIGNDGGAPAAGSLTKQVTESEGFIAFRDRKADRASIPISGASLLHIERRNTILSPVSGDPVDPSIAPGMRLPNIASGPQRRAWLHELMPAIPTGAGSVEFVREDSFTNAAASQFEAPSTTEGALKAESGITFELIEAKIPTIAHWVRASRQALSDSAALNRHLDMRLRYGLLLALESQIVGGDGTDGTMKGLTAAGNFTAYDDGPVDDTAIDAIRRALGQLETAEYIPDVVILHPDDWTLIELLKDEERRYLIGDPKAPSSKIIWNRLVHTTTAMPAGHFIAASLAQATTFHPREDASLLISPHDGDNFRRNLVTILAELRAVMTVSLPAGVIYGELPDIEVS